MSLSLLPFLYFVYTDSVCYFDFGSGFSHHKTILRTHMVSEWTALSIIVKLHCEMWSIPIFVFQLIITSICAYIHAWKQLRCTSVVRRSLYTVFPLKQVINTLRTSTASDHSWWTLVPNIYTSIQHIYYTYLTYIHTYGQSIYLVAICSSQWYSEAWAIISVWKWNTM